MRILTYNVYVAPLVRLCPSANIEKIAKLIDSEDPDIVCIQGQRAPSARRVESIHQRNLTAYAAPPPARAELFEFTLGPLGKAFEMVCGGHGWFSPLFFLEGLLLPMFQTTHQIRMAKLLEHKWQHRLYSPAARHAHNQGLLTLSKLPITDTCSVRTPGLVVHHMGFQIMSVGGIRLVNVHLIPDFRWHPWKSYVLALFGERDVERIHAQQLASVEEAVRQCGNKWCVVGDFNSVEPKVLTLGSSVKGVTCPGDGKTIDHMITPLPHKYRILRCALSDHYPVLFDVQI